MKLSGYAKELFDKHKNGAGLAAFLIFGGLFAHGIRYDVGYTDAAKYLLVLIVVLAIAFGKFVWREGIIASLLMGLAAAIAYMYLGTAILGLAKLLFVFDLPNRILPD